jgi:hypothetical protein
LTLTSISELSLAAERAEPTSQEGRSKLTGQILATAAKRHAWGIAAVAWSATIAGWLGARLGRWIIDDAGISFAYARSFATGHGPVVQPGAAPVEGYSNPTWVALLAIGRWSGLFDHGAWFGVPDYIVFPKALGLLCIVGIVACFYAATLVLFASRRVAALVTAAAGTLLGFMPSFVIWSFSGLENSLYGLIVTALAVLMLRAIVADRLLAARTAAIAGVLVALAALTRPDGVIYMGAYPAVVLLSIGREAVRPAIRAVAVSGLAFAAAFGPYLLWRRFEFGRWVPNTAVAKSQQTPNAATIDRTVDILQYPGIAISLVAIVITVATMAGVRRLRRPLVALVVPLVLALAAYCVLDGDWMGQLRFATPIWTLAALAATVCAAHLLAQPGLRSRIGLSAVLAASLYLAQDNFGSALADAAAHPVVPLCSVAERNGEMFNKYADIAGVGPGTLLVPDLGGTALTSRLELRDLAGLTDARVADYYKKDDMNGLRDYIFDVMQPTFIQAHNIWSDRLGAGDNSDPRLLRDYVQIYTSDRIYGSPADRNTDWIRKSELKSPSTLAQLRAYARAVGPAMERRENSDPIGTCTDRLAVGQVPRAGH